MKRRTMKRLLGAVMSFSLLLQPVVSSTNQLGYGNVALAQDKKVEVKTDEDATKKVSSSSNKVTVNSEDKKTDATLSGGNRSNDSPAVSVDQDGNVVGGIVVGSETLSFAALIAKTKTPDDVDFDNIDSISAALANENFPFKPDSEWDTFLRTQIPNHQNWQDMDFNGAKWYRDYYKLRLQHLRELSGLPLVDGGRYTVSIQFVPALRALNDAVGWDTHTNRFGETVSGGFRPGSELSWLSVGGGLVWCLQPHRLLNNGTAVTGRQDVSSKLGHDVEQNLAKILYVAQGNRDGVNLRPGDISFERYVAGQLLIWGYMRQGANVGDIPPGMTITEWYPGAVDRINAEMEDIRNGIERLEGRSNILATGVRNYTVKPGATVEVPLSVYERLTLTSSGIIESAIINGTNVTVKIKERAALNGETEGLLKIDKDKDRFSIIERYQPDNATLQQTAWVSRFGDPANARVTFTLENEPVGNLKIKKVDAENDALVPYAKFNITGPEGYNQDVVVNNGELVLENLKIGEYTVREIEAHGGYILGEGEHKVTVTENGTVELKVTNTKIKGSFGIYKRETFLDKGIAGVKFKLEGTSKVTNERVALEQVTDEHGNLQFNNLEVGTYTLTEETPEGYVKNNKTYTVEVVKANAGDKVAKVTVKDGTEELPQLEGGIVTIDNTQIRGNIKIVKKGSGNWMKDLYEAFLLEGAEFGVYDAKGVEVAKAKTNALGVVEFNNLLKGKYTIKETLVPEGYDKVADFEVEITEHGKTITVEKVDEVRKGKLKVVKVDKESGKPVNFAGAQFKIKNLQTNQYVQQEGKDIFETDANGEFTTPLDLLYGKYELYEVKAPEGYVLNSEPVQFTITGEETLVSLNFSDDRVKGKLELTKTGSVATGVEKADGTYGTEYTLTMGQGRNLEGVEFEVYAKEDITLKTGGVVKKVGELVGKITTDANGKGVLEGLEVGKYTLKETKALDGYLPAKDVDFEITYEGQDKAVVVKSTTVENDYRQVKLVLDKEEQKQVGLDVDKDKEHGVAKYENVAGADKVFVVRTKDAIHGAKGEELVPANGVVATLTTDEKGHAEKVLNLPDGTYTVQEVKTTEGLELDNTVREFTVKTEGHDAIKEINLAKETIGKDKFLNLRKPIKINTTATYKADGSQKVPYDKDVTIVDKVEYKNLIVGRTYELKGRLMDKTTGQPLLINGKEIVASKTFVPTKPDGVEELEFTFNSKNLQGKQIVVFEDLYQDKIHVATHSDINDKGQTVTVETPKDKPKLPNTATKGDFSDYSLGAFGALVLAGIAFVVVRKRKED